MGDQSLRPKTTPDRPTRFVRLRNLKCFEEVRAKLVEGTEKLEDIAHFIQEERREYTDIKADTLMSLLTDFRGIIPKVELAAPIPGVIKKAKEALDRGLDELGELEKLYRIQLDRINIDFGNEKRMGKLFKTTGSEVYIAMRILKNLAELKMDLGIDKRHLGELSVENHLTADLTARVGIGRADVSKVLQDPSSRRKVLNLAERMLLVGRQSADEVREDVAEDGQVVDAELVPAKKTDEEK